MQSLYLIFKAFWQHVSEILVLGHLSVVQKANDLIQALNRGWKLNVHFATLGEGANGNLY